MPIWNFLSNMNKGELDPLLAGRIDIQAYYNGVKTAKNVLALPQGGLKRRPGMMFLGETSTATNGRLENFSFNVEQNYLLVFTDSRMQIYKDDVLQTNINGSGLDYLPTPWNLQEAQRFDYIQSADTAIVVEEGTAPRSITRTSDTAWTITTITLSNIPQYDFNDGSSPTPVSEVQDITFAAAVEGDRYKLSLEGVLTDELTFAADDATNEEVMRSAVQGIFGVGSSGVSVAVQTTLTKYRITLAGDSADDWNLITATPVRTNSASFAGTTVRIAGGTSRAQDVWSNGRGWPVTATFHEGRLYFGGTTQRPATIWGSNVNDFFNFDIGRSRDDEAIIITLDTDQVNAIEALYSNRSFQIFTSGAEFAISASPITPVNVAVVPQTNFGSKKIKPVNIDGVTVFAQRTGKVINQLVFQRDFQANQVSPISVLSPHLIKNPTELAVKKGTASSDANYVYVLNDDGTLAVYNSLASEGVGGFTTWESGDVAAIPTTGIRSIAVVGDVLYALVGRITLSGTEFFIERELSTSLTDSSVTTTVGGSPTLSGLGHLEGLTVDVKADGAYQGEFVVSGGAVTITRDAQVIEAGLPYAPTIKTMPLNIGLANGPNAASKKKILRAAVHLYESNGVLVNGERLADKTIGIDQFNAPTPQTGFKRITLLGWSLEADITITQTTPFDMTILSIGMEVKS